MLETQKVARKENELDLKMALTTEYPLVKPRALPLAQKSDCCWVSSTAMPLVAL